MNIKLMKSLVLLSLFVSQFVFAQTDADLQKIKSILLENFPENIQFISYEHNQIELKDTMYFRFHRPEIEISQDSIHFSYIKEDKDWNENFSRFEKLEWNLAFKDLNQFFGFEFTFGNWDRFRPNLLYWNFEGEETKVRITELTLEEFQNNQIPENKSTEYEHSAWFPTKIQSHWKLEKVINKLIKKR